MIFTFFLLIVCFFFFVFFWVVSTCAHFCLVFLIDVFMSLIFIYKVFLLLGISAKHQTNILIPHMSNP
jgi:hypothetical protein